MTGQFPVLSHSGFVTPERQTACLFPRPVHDGSVCILIGRRRVPSFCNGERYAKSPWNDLRRNWCVQGQACGRDCGFGGFCDRDAAPCPFHPYQDIFLSCDFRAIIPIITIITSFCGLLPAFPEVSSPADKVQLSADLTAAPAMRQTCRHDAQKSRPKTHHGDRDELQGQ